VRLLVRRDRVSVVCDERFNMWITANSHKVFSRFKIVDEGFFFFFIMA